MNNVQLLQVDLTHLSSEAKKRYPDVRQLADSVIKSLKSLNATTQLKDITDDSLRLQTINALILACDSGNLKLNNASIPIMQKLIQARFIPKEKLKDVLRTFSDNSHLAEGVQVRILQCLQQFTQEYKQDISGVVLSSMVGLCSGLTTTNKASNVSGVASATLEQVFSNVFDNISDAPLTGSNEIKIENELDVQVDDASYEGFRVFEDLNSLATNKKPKFLNAGITIRSQSALDIIENVILSHDKLFRQHKELAYLLRAQTVPSLLKVLNSPSRSYQLTQRSIRVIQSLLTTQLESLEIEVELILSYLNHALLENDNHQNGSVPYWEKILVLEMFKNVFSKFDVVKAIYENYDHDESKKDVLKELFTVLNSYLQNDNSLKDEALGYGDVQDITTYNHHSTSDLSNTVPFSRKNFKISLLDHLDKTEPQTNIPGSYTQYLIFEILVNYCNGVSHFVTTLSDNTSNEQVLEEDVDFINAILASTASEVSHLFKRFIYAQLDDELFRTLLTSFQKFAHSVGLLGLNSIRNELLSQLAKAAIVSVNSTTPTKEDNESSSLYDDSKKHLLALGGSLAESVISSRISMRSESNGANNTLQQENSISSNYFNSRHVLCLRTLLNLAISLGSTLGESWAIIWITSQWCACYLYGPDEYSNFSRSKQSQELGVPVPQQQLSETDYGIIQASLRSLFENISSYESDSFKQLLACLIELNDIAFSEDVEKVVKLGLSESPFNKAYFLQKIFQICRLAPAKFLIEDDAGIWELVTSYITKFGSKRNLHPKLRLYVAESFGNIVEALASAGFKDDSIAQITATRTLEGLHQYITPLFEQGPPKELLTLNCETEIHLSVLTKLHSLIDNYDTHYQGSWAQVFEVLNTPFKAVESDDVNLREKLQYLVEKSFDTLKLILDEFLSSLPFKQFKYLIDTLVNFSSQTYDLNISFSSVSYFWLISDSLKSRLGHFEGHKSMPIDIESENELVAFIDSNDESYQSYVCLEVYLLFCLAKLSQQETNRAQVRDGALQTFFQIVDVHGPALEQSWDVVHLLVLPCLFSIGITSTTEATITPKESLETIRLLLEGFTNMYRKFFTTADKTSEFQDRWQKIFDYMEKLLSLKHIEINSIVFKSIRDLIDPSTDISTREIRSALFKLWTGYTIEYDLVNSSYQDSLVQYMQCFPPLYKIIQSELNLQEVNKIVDIFNKGARYPVLPLHQSDINKPSKLQSAILANIGVLDKDDLEIQASVVQLLTNIIIYPCGVRMRIEQKFHNNAFVQKNYQIPTFVAVSHLGLQLMRSKFEEFGYTQVLTDEQGIIKTLKALIEVVEKKLSGISTTSSASSSQTPLWSEAHQVLKTLVEKLINGQEGQLSSEVWTLLVQSMMVTFAFRLDVDLSADDSNVKIAHYQELSRVIVPSLIKNDNSLILELARKMYDNSYLYNLNADEEELILNSSVTKNDIQAIDNLTSFQFDEFFSTTESLRFFPNTRIRFNCLLQLFELSQFETKFKPDIEIYLLRRISFTLRRAVADLRLSGGRPLPRFQQDEIVTILEQLQDKLSKESDSLSRGNMQEFKKLNRLLVLLSPFADKLGERKSLIPELLMKCI
ncbi:MON2 [Candida theae]|uniref:MON2 n=1 Tax=Candida theae TaxID=1198502 RepID=A0AAD5B9Y3_9ASCO|nr:MON2 [Candida theae]KAI5948815.1 MON2 [Candida theae]